MLPAKIRFASLFAVALAAVLLAMSGHSALVSATGQDSAQPMKKDTKLQGLLEERLAAAQKLVRQNEARFRAGQSGVEEVFQAARLAHEAALDLCKTDEERIKVLRDFLAAAKEYGRVAEAFHKTGQGRESAVLFAKVERLRVEIALERAQQKATGKEGKGLIPPPKKAEPAGSIKLPATIQAFESVQLFAHASGFLKGQPFDIGDRVKKGQVLATVDVPDLEAQVRLDQAGLDQVRARIEAAKSRIKIAQAELEAATIAVEQAEAGVKGAASAVKLSELQLKRMKNLFAAKAVDENVLAEHQERHAVAADAETTAKLAVGVAKAHVAAGQAKIDQVKADAVAAAAEVQAAQMKLDLSKVQLSFATITAPFDGVITQRNFWVGDFIRSAGNAAKQPPLFIVQRTDLMRVVVAVPEADIAFLDVGAEVIVEVAAIPGKQWQAKLSRLSSFVDPKTGCMRAEIDVRNSGVGHPIHVLYPGMYGTVTIRPAERK